MKRKYISLLICTITLLFLKEIFIHTEHIIESFYEGTILWFNNIIPFLFPFFIITDILNNYNLTKYLNLIFGKLVNKLFKVPKQSSIVFFMSLLSGFPGNSKFVKELLDNKIINETDATKILTFTHFSNPLFIIGTIGINFLHNKKIGIIILIIHFLTNILIGLLFRNIYHESNKNYIKENHTQLPFMVLLKNSILNTINTLFIIYGIIIFFALTTTIININLNTSLYIKIFINGLLEMTNGLKALNDLNTSIIIKATLSTFFISFGGLSIHMQVMSILSDYKINYYIYFLSRILHATISSIIVYLFLTYY